MFSVNLNSNSNSNQGQGEGQRQPKGQQDTSSFDALDVEAMIEDFHRSKPPVPNENTGFFKLEGVEAIASPIAADINATFIAYYPDIPAAKIAQNPGIVQAIMAIQERETIAGIVEKNQKSSAEHDYVTAMYSAVTESKRKAARERLQIQHDAASLAYNEILAELSKEKEPLLKILRN